MNARFNLERLQKQRGSTILGLTLDGSRLDGVVLRRTNGAVQVEKAFAATLSLDPMTNDAELVGREIRNCLTGAGVRERRCVVGLPLRWALTVHTHIPQIPEADVASFLQIEAERSFPCDVSTLMVATSRYQASPGEAHATLIGIPRAQVDSLEAVLRGAQLKPVSFSLGLAALQPPKSDASNGVLAFAIGENHVGLQISCGEGIAALRTLEGMIDTDGGQRRLHADVIAREARITLAQLPAAIRASVRRVRVFGPRDLGQQLTDELELRLEALGLEFELVTHYPAMQFGVQIPANTPVSPAVSLAIAQLAEHRTTLEFLPPRVTAWHQFASRYSSGRLQQAGIAAAALGLLVGGAFLFQTWQLWRLEKQWAAIKRPVRELEDANARIKQFRPWFDDNIRGLTILRSLAQAFPDDGSVTAKTVEIRDLGTVTCTGVARDYGALLKTVAQLRTVRQIPEVNLGQTRGQPPSIQFSFSFAWSEGGRNAN